MALGLLSFTGFRVKTNLNTEYLPVLYFQENSTSYSGYIKAGETLKDTTEILFFINSFLEKNPIVSIELCGASDFSEENKYDLSLNRAKKVFADLIRLGVKADRLTTKGVADTRPAMTIKVQKGCKKDKECWSVLKQINRTVYFFIKNG